MGILQFRASHNLQDNSCLAAGNCFINFEEEDDPASWLADIVAESNLAVLHCDRSIPWLSFDENPPPGVSRTEFFDARIDAAPSHLSMTARTGSSFSHQVACHPRPSGSIIF